MKFVPLVLACLMTLIMLVGLWLLFNSGIKASIDQCNPSKVQAICQEIKELNQ